MTLVVLPRRVLAVWFVAGVVLMFTVPGAASAWAISALTYMFCGRERFLRDRR